MPIVRIVYAEYLASRINYSQHSIPTAFTVTEGLKDAIDVRRIFEKIFNRS